MALNLDEVRRIATLARLRLTPREEVRFAGQLGAIVDYIDQLQAFPAEEPAAGGAGVREAEDRLRPGLPRELFLANAPEAMDGFLLVPEVKGVAEG